ncbi:MAG: enoyl-CoA hydratase [Pseudomonadales bacterium]|nr:enoyl-CoA hydratase [Gammaproteobacteria bacterium]MDP6025424.1 enoyl-CoA hydratase [Pseudomonadales bacterium]MDP7452772.1 enoyl-CoA hydratase [Arenicellales bacterium]MDP6316697.1 enoyl-CoA hydratase [Pseudomonadales bacterium]MDP7313456.1 enoyl-CoA hydratase [Pseudomonadales bacterium]
MTDIDLQTTKILARTENQVGWITFNQPEKRNAISLEMWQGIGDSLENFENDSSIKAVVMTGAGGRAFASGADISEFDQHRANAEQRRQYAEISERGHYWLASFSKPLIAMINGFCIGGGLAIALNADIRFATPDSRFGVPAAKLGLGYEYGGLAKLARLVGPSTARDIMFTARFLESDEAQRIGLINFIEPAERIENAVAEYVAVIADNAPLTIKAAKAAVNTFERYSILEGVKEVSAMVDACFDSEDYKEGRLAFSEKRKPEFKGR